MIVETESVVLHAIDYGDTSKIVTLYTQRYGKIKVIAKGVRSQKNKFGSSLEPMTISSVVLYKKEHRDLHLLSKSEIRTPLSKLQSDAERMFTALATVELVNMVMHDEEENVAVYALLTETLQTIDASARNQVNVLLSFMLKLFTQFGFGIRLDRCSTCGRTVNDGAIPFASLRLSDGSLVCSHCGGGSGAAGVKIDGGILKSLHYLQHTEISRAPVLTIDRSAVDTVLTIVQSYLQYHSEGSRTLKSLSLLFSKSDSRKK
jgi:DNA repair protein RecO (recombination protein O)